MKQFKSDIEGAFAQPLSLNIYDSEFYSQVRVIQTLKFHSNFLSIDRDFDLNVFDDILLFQYDGSLDFGRTSSCFQVLREEDTVGKLVIFKTT